MGRAMQPPSAGKADRSRPLNTWLMYNFGSDAWPALREAHEIDPRIKVLNDGSLTGYATLNTAHLAEFDWAHWREFRLRAPGSNAGRWTIRNDLLQDAPRLTGKISLGEEEDGFATGSAFFGQHSFCHGVRTGPRWVDSASSCPGRVGGGGVCLVSLPSARMAGTNRFLGLRPLLGAFAHVVDGGFHSAG